MHNTESNKIDVIDEIIEARTYKDAPRAGMLFSIRDQKELCIILFHSRSVFDTEESDIYSDIIYFDPKKRRLQKMRFALLIVKKGIVYELSIANA